MPLRGYFTAIVRAGYISASIALGLTTARAEDPEPLHVQVARAVFRLEHQDSISRFGQEKPEIVLRPDGTGFLITYNHRLFLVTARHVAAEPYDLRARVPAKRNDNGSTEVVALLVPKDAWVFHDQGPGTATFGTTVLPVSGVDVAAVAVPSMSEYGIVSFNFCSPCSPGETSQLAEADPSPPAAILVTGFPGDLGLTLREPRPMFRSGVIALVAGEQFLRVDGAYADERSFIIDRRVQPGNSGSPVFSVGVFNGLISLVGLVSASNETWDFTVAEPASRIRETLVRAAAVNPPRSAEWHQLPQ